MQVPNYIVGRKVIPERVNVFIVRKLHFAFCRRLLRSMFNLSYSQRVFVRDKINKVIVSTTSNVKVCRFLLKVNVLIQCGISTYKYCMARKLFMDVKMILWGFRLMYY